MRSAAGQVCALKTLQSALADDRESAEGLLAEEWLAKRLMSKHFPQVVPIASSARHHLYYVMTFHAGATLQQHIDNGKHFAVTDVAQLGVQVAKALGVLHRLSIIHRDIKPANLLLDESGDLRVLDMGCGTGILGILASMRGAIATCSPGTSLSALRRTCSFPPIRWAL